MAYGESFIPYPLVSPDPDIQIQVPRATASSKTANSFLVYLRNMAMRAHHATEHCSPPTATATLLLHDREHSVPPTCSEERRQLEPSSFIGLLDRIF